MTRQPRFSRSALVERARQGLLRRGFPRLQMLMIVTVTGLAGFLASWLMLRAGVDSMGLRYLLAVGVAYLVFLLQLWIWLRTGETLDGDPPVPGGSRGSSPDTFAGRGGESSGGDASASFDSPSTFHSGGTKQASGWPDVSDLGDADEFTIPLVVVIAILALATSFIVIAFSLVWSAPVLFAELLVDGVLAASLYRRLRGLDPAHWLETAVRRTFWPFLVAAVIAGAVGWGLQQYQPTARTIGDVIDARADSRKL